MTTRDALRAALDAEVPAFLDMIMGSAVLDKLTDAILGDLEADCGPPEPSSAADFREGMLAAYRSVLRGLHSEDDTPQLRAIIASVEYDRAAIVALRVALAKTPGEPR